MEFMGSKKNNFTIHTGLNDKTEFEEFENVTYLGAQIDDKIEKSSDINSRIAKGSRYLVWR